MAFDRAFLDELVARNDILEIVSQYVPLKKSGSNYFGLCPFHNEKSPSFSVAPDKQIYHCFGCGAGGGVISFIMQAEGLEFPDAVRFLADKVGMEIPVERADRAKFQKRERLLKLCKDAARFFYETLWMPEQVSAQQYFLQRGLHKNVMRRFGLGFAPNQFSALTSAMQAKGYTLAELQEVGLLVQNEKGNRYDRFRNRVIFPIIDVRGDVIAFGGRVLDDSKPKYLNSPESMIFYKSRHLFALNIAKKTKLDYFILAEGYMDVIALHQAGFDSAVASLGTSLTEEQAHLIARYTKNIVISYDADGAGQAATQRAIEILKKTQLNVKVIRIPGSKDPDEFIKTHGADAYCRLIEEANPHIAYRIASVQSKYTMQTEEERIAFVRECAGILARVDSAVEREVYTGRVAELAHIKIASMQAEVDRQLAILKKKQKSTESKKVRAPVLSAQPKERMLQYTNMRSARAEEGIIRILFADISCMQHLQDRLCTEDFSSSVLCKIYEQAKVLYEEGHMLTVSALEGSLDATEMRHLVSILDEPLATTKREQALEDYMHIIKQEKQKQIEGADDLLSFAKNQRETKRYDRRSE